MSYLFDDFFYPERLLLRDNFFFPERRLLRDWFDDEPRRMRRRRISDDQAEPRQQQALARPNGLMQCAPSFEFQAEKDAAIVRVLTPGLAEEDLNVKIEGRNLTISGGTKKEETGEGYSRRSYQNFTRSWMLPPELDVDGVTAEYKDGVLELRVPRVEQPEKVSKTVAIGDKTAAPTLQVEASKQGQNADVIMNETAGAATKPIVNPTDQAEPRQQQALARPNGLMQCAPSFEFQAEKDAAIVRVLTPGLAKEDLNVKIEGRNLTISGGTKKEETGEGYSRRSYQNFTRSWMLPPELDVDGVTAEYKDGVLELRVPRVEQPEKVSKTVAIGDKTAAPTPQVEASKQGQSADVIMNETAGAATKPIVNPTGEQQRKTVAATV